MKAWILTGLLALIALAPVFALVYYYDKNKDASYVSVQFESEKHNKKLEVGVELTVKSCKVLDGFRYQMFLEGDRWIEGHLSVAAKEEAGKVATDLLKQATSPPPTVTLLRRVGGYWVVDFHVTVDGKRSSVLDLLRDRELLL